MELHYIIFTVHCIKVAYTHTSSQKKKYRIKSKFMCRKVGNGKTFHAIPTWLFEQLAGAGHITATITNGRKVTRAGYVPRNSEK